MTAPTVTELVRMALSAGDAPADWAPFVHQAMARPPEEVMTVAGRLLAQLTSTGPALGAVLLHDLVATRPEVRAEVGDMLTLALDPGQPVLALDVLLDTYRRTDGPLFPVVALRRHPEPIVRAAVVRVLYGSEEARALEALVELTADSDRAVQVEALFALGSQVDTDSDRIRAALAAALDSDDEDVRREAAVGLGRRGDARAVDVLADALADGDASIGVLEAAARLADPVLLPPLVILQAAPGDHDPWLLERAVLACRPGSWS